MRTKKSSIVGRCLSIVVIGLLLVTVTNGVMADSTEANLSMPSLPIGMERTVSNSNVNPVDYGFTEPTGGFDDGFQIRQTLMVSVTPSYSTVNNRLNGYAITILVYFTALVSTHTASFLGNVTFIMDDGSTRSYPAGYSIVFSTLSPGLPLLMYQVVTFRWISLTCKAVYVSIDHVEDGQFIRHVEKAWANKPFGVQSPVVSLPSASMAGNELMLGERAVTSIALISS